MWSIGPLLAWLEFVFEIPLHPKLVHVPLGLSAVVPLMLLALMLAIWRKWLPERAWWLGALLTLVVAGSAGLALRTGEMDEERVESIVGEAAIERHEAAAGRFFAGAGITAALAILSALLRRRGPRTAAQAVTSIAACVTLALGVRTGQLGGELIYRHDAAKAYTSPAGVPKAGKAAVGDGDD